MEQKKKILIVDDAVSMRQMIADIVVEEGYMVVGMAGNGKDAVDLYQQYKPDLVTMDIIMPQMDGIEAVKQIISLNKNACIVMVSAMGQQEQVMEAMQAGAKDFIVKPFHNDRVIGVLHKLLGREK